MSAENADLQDEKASQEIQKYVDKKKELYDVVLNFLEDSEDSDMSFKNLVNSQNREDFEHFLCFVTDLANNHHRDDQFLKKIFQILNYYSNQIRQTFSNLEIFNIFISNKLILLFLFENKIITVDDNIYLELMNIVEENGCKYCHFFYPEIKEFIGDEKSANIKDEISSLYPDILDEFDEKRHKGENHLFVCSLIRNDSVEDFISYINKKSISVSSQINHSIFETNPFLIENQATLIEYAAFFGSIQIFQYLKMSGADLCDSLWMYSIHSRNPEFFHLLEENKVDPPENHKKSYLESIKCHHDEFAVYIKENLMDLKNPSVVFFENIVLIALKYHNYKYFPSDFTHGYELLYLTRFHYDTLANLFMKRNEKRIEMIIKEDDISLQKAADSNMIDVMYFLLSNIKRIDETIFRTLEFLKRIALPPSIRSIGKNAFSKCENLEQIIIPSSVASIGDSAFSECSSLKQIMIPSSVTTIGNSIFYECSSLKQVQIPSSITSIGSHVFSGCSSLVHITIPSSVTSIKKSTFYGCSSLVQITIPSSVTSIEEFAFSRCHSLKKVIIPSSVTSIGQFAFLDCSSLCDLLFTASNVEIGDYAFYGCTALNRPDLTKMEPFTNLDDYEINELINCNWSVFHLKVTHKATGKNYLMSVYPPNHPLFKGDIGFLMNIAISKNKNVIKIHSFRFPLSEEEVDQADNLYITRIFQGKEKEIDLSGYITISDLMVNGNIYDHTIKYLKNPYSDKNILNPTIRSKIIFGVASILKHLHKNGVIHRDFKLQKVYLDEKFEPVIKCFSLSIFDANPQELESNVGTPLCMAPELFMDCDIRYSFPVDVYSYGFFLYHMFSDSRELDSNKKYKSAQQYLMHISRGFRPKRQDYIPDHYWDLMSSCWKQNPDDRPTFEEITNILKDDKFALEEYVMNTDLEQLHEYQQRIDVD